MNCHAFAKRLMLSLALAAVITGAAVCAALLNLDMDVSNQLTREFRTLGEFQWRTRARC